MPVTTSKYASVETTAFSYLTKNLGFNTAVACGILANMERESGFNPTATNIWSGAYGLCQWLGTRKSALWRYRNRNTANTQLFFLHYELNNTEKKTLDYLKTVPDTAAGAYDAGEKFSSMFERHGNSREDANRGALARDTYYKYYASETSGTPSSSKDIGQTIVQAAREQIGKPFRTGGTGPSSFDDAGLVYYSYKVAGESISDASSNTLYKKYSTEGKVVSYANMRAGDLLFYKTPSINYVAIANGEGGRIYINEYVGVVIEDKTQSYNPTYIIRILEDSETSQTLPSSGSPGDSSGDSSETIERVPITSIEQYASIATSDPYLQTVARNLSRVESAGYDYGYLIDMTNTKEEFKFYVPEFSESAGANWSPIDIVGRSVSIQSYNSTSSRKITVNLDLYAGVGVYKGVTDDPVGKLHSDANFIKSLEYPDYTNPITRPPATVQLILGSAINMIGVVSGVSIEHLKPLDVQNRSMYLKVSFTVTQIAINPPDYRDIRDNQYARISTDNVGSINPSNDTTIAPNYTSGGQVR